MNSHAQIHWYQNVASSPDYSCLTCASSMTSPWLLLSCLDFDSIRLPGGPDSQKPTRILEQNPCLRDSGPCFLQQLDGGCGVLESGLANGGFWSSRIKIARLHLQVKPSKNMSMQYYFILTSSAFFFFLRSASKSIDSPSSRRRNPQKQEKSSFKKCICYYKTPSRKGKSRHPRVD